mmetsp:Transcript_64407/g.153637  ORF Transcript_64407/g.153637 Transcript_64407/m.153637 type:complete len:522 (+) Transcript_64407:56-1621(+)|eukprot:CAMPEP_0178451998 /NCGR_PEP_ID=MMETSP0689_2-20121128/43993_1 /TAXON_ID=160604 /ORGANISM="Amphidinium massartii, Strain CS-259" /LENGTH=521 /DNA_ID=CAMNT_0020077641 /DNA_START=44 /DNA_END=1609 /DNA_ORIENTATION=+
MQVVRVGGDKKSGPDTPVKASNAASSFKADTLALSFYTSPPQDEVSVAEFQDATLDRLKVLHTIDRVCGFEPGLAKVIEQKNAVGEALNNARLVLRYPMNFNVDSFLRAKEDYRRRDEISLFSLLIIFCKNRDMRQWFLKQEQRLFVFRFEALSPEAREVFLAESGVDCKKFDQSTSDMKLHELQLVTPGARIWRDGKPGPPEYDDHFYEMPFHQVSPHLISSRRVVLQRGKAYFPSSALRDILVARLKENLSTSLDTAFQNLEAALQDLRIGDFLRAVQHYGPQLLAAPKASSAEDVGEKLSTENFEEMMQRSFPPCMRRMVEMQREKRKHLKHAGRLQLRPFLKDIGFTYEESLSWWQQELCLDTEIDGVSFEKNYKYDVDHTYGKKGHFQGQNSFGCAKIINFPDLSAGQCHGCIFRHLDMPSLRQQLHAWRLPEASMNEIEQLITRGKHYQLACVEYFKATHPTSDGDGVGNTPKDYFRESCRYHKKLAEKRAGGSGGVAGASQTETAAEAKAVGGA